MPCVWLTFYDSQMKYNDSFWIFSIRNFTPKKLGSAKQKNHQYCIIKYLFFFLHVYLPTHMHTFSKEMKIFSLCQVLMTLLTDPFAHNDKNFFICQGLVSVLPYLAIYREFGYFWHQFATKISFWLLGLFVNFFGYFGQFGKKLVVTSLKLVLDLSLCSLM